jgi:hypothetical protein
VSHGSTAHDDNGMVKLAQVPERTKVLFLATTGNKCTILGPKEKRIVLGSDLSLEEIANRVAAQQSVILEHPSIYADIRLSGTREKKRTGLMFPHYPVSQQLVDTTNGIYTTRPGTASFRKKYGVSVRYPYKSIRRNELLSQLIIPIDDGLHREYIVEACRGVNDPLDEMAVRLRRNNRKIVVPGTRGRKRTIPVEHQHPLNTMMRSAWLESNMDPRGLYNNWKPLNVRDFNSRLKNITRRVGAMKLNKQRNPWWLIE